METSPKITYQNELNLSPEAFRELLVKSTLGERRPVEDLKRMSKMCQHAGLMITARLEENGQLVGIARSISDFTYCTYLSDLAVDQEFQKMGIGKRLIEETKKAAPTAKLILLSAPAAVDYYPKIGMEKHPHCYFL